MEDVTRMSNQERINLLGVEEASKYHGPHKRRNDQVEYHPACTQEGGQFYLSQLALQDEAKKKRLDYKINPTPREYVVQIPSYKRKKIEAPKTQAFKRSDIRCRKSLKNRAKVG